MNDLGFSLYVVLSVYYRVVTSKRRTEFKRVSFGKKYITVKHQSLVFNRLKITVYLLVFEYRIL